MASCKRTFKIVSKIIKHTIVKMYIHKSTAKIVRNDEEDFSNTIFIPKSESIVSQKL